MLDYATLLKQIDQVEAKLGYTFKDKTLLAMAFVHRSYVNEDKTRVINHNERLEFLGDAVLSLLISTYLFTSLPSCTEGELSTFRAKLVDASSCMTYAQKWGIEGFVLLGKGERLNEGRGRENILADLFEAVIGAIYLDGGMKEVEKLFFNHFLTAVQEIVKAPAQNAKASLQDFAQRKFQKTPVYNVLQESGPDHAKLYEVEVVINDHRLGVGRGMSKKEAQQNAAIEALERLQFLERKDG